MNDKDRDLVERVVHAVGNAGAEGFEHLVRYTQISGVIDAFGYAAWAGVAVYLGKRLHAWKPDAGWDNDIAYFFRGAGMLICAGFVMASIAGEASSIAAILEPAGTAIRKAIRGY